MNQAELEPFYGAAARSMSASWHGFFFGALDPAGTVTVDKLPGALWLQALSLRIFGFHVWAVVLPQVVEGVITVLVLFRLMRRLVGPVAGIVAAAVLALSPVTVALNRGNVSDSLLIMLTVLAADATVSAILSGRLRTLLIAGAWIGLAFQAKMLQAWAILPALAIAYVVAAPAPLRVRVKHLMVAGLVALAVSLSWLTVVSLVPAQQRPYVDGTQNDSVFSQVFEYNGIARLGRSRPAGAGHRAEFLTRLEESEPELLLDEHVPPSWHRLLDGLYGRDIGWFLPAALISAVALLIASRGRGRRDPRRTIVLLWGVWLVVLWVLFSDAVFLHSYYVAALAPALAGLCGGGAELAWSHRRNPATRYALAATTIASLAYGAYLLDGGVRVPGWLVALAVCVGVAGAVALLATGTVAPRRNITGGAVAAAVCGALVIPAVASALMVTRGLGPFVAPFEPASAGLTWAQVRERRVEQARIVAVVGSTYQTPIALAVDTSRVAAPFILASGREILPIGGYEGGIPSPTLAQLRHYVSKGSVRAFLIPRVSTDPRLVWIYAHCRRTTVELGAELALYDCGAT
jgi:4-amino-4-deoxy-L-arabinose transferase-like glycosyltransferase